MFPYLGNKKMTLDFLWNGFLGFKQYWEKTAFWRSWMESKFAGNSFRDSKRKKALEISSNVRPALRCIWPKPSRYFQAANFHCYNVHYQERNWDIFLTTKQIYDQRPQGSRMSRIKRNNNIIVCGGLCRWQSWRYINTKRPDTSFKSGSFYTTVVERNDLADFLTRRKRQNCS